MKTTFSKLPKWKQRVAIAKDVIKQIKVKKYVAEAGAYIKELELLDGDYLGIGINNIDRYSIKSKFDEIKKCDVCALGACLLSATKFVNKLKFEEIKNVNQLTSSRNVKAIFQSIFTKHQLLIIETTFEG